MELQRTVSLLQSTLNSTADGILVVDHAGRMVSYNERFVSLWQMPQNILESRNDDAALAEVLHGALQDRAQRDERSVDRD